MDTQCYKKKPWIPSEQSSLRREKLGIHTPLPEKLSRKVEHEKKLLDVRRYALLPIMFFVGLSFIVLLFHHYTVIIFFQEVKMSILSKSSNSFCHIKKISNSISR